MTGLFRLTKRICLLIIVSSEKPVEVGYYIIIYLGKFLAPGAQISVWRPPPPRIPPTNL